MAPHAHLCPLGAAWTLGSGLEGDGEEKTRALSLLTTCDHTRNRSHKSWAEKQVVRDAELGSFL